MPIKLPAVAVTFLPKACIWRVWHASVLARRPVSSPPHSHPGGCPSDSSRSRSPCHPAVVCVTGRVTASRHLVARPWQRIDGASERAAAGAASGAHYRGDAKGGREGSWMEQCAERVVTVSVWCWVNLDQPPRSFPCARDRDSMVPRHSRNRPPEIGPSSTPKSNDSRYPNLHDSCRGTPRRRLDRLSTEQPWRASLIRGTPTRPLIWRIFASSSCKLPTLELQTTACRPRIVDQESRLTCRNPPAPTM